MGCGSSKKVVKQCILIDEIEVVEYIKLENLNTTPESFNEILKAIAINSKIKSLLIRNLIVDGNLY